MLKNRARQLAKQILHLPLGWARWWRDRWRDTAPETYKWGQQL